MTYTPRPNSGASLNKKWNVGAADARYHRDGKFFMPLNRFPGALFDPDGYLLFQTKEAYENSPYLNRGKRLNVPGGISSVLGYRRMRTAKFQEK